MKQDRFLMGILAGIVLLVALALLLFFTRKESSTVYKEENTPEASAYNYVLALHQKDYERAYSYLADTSYKPARDVFRRIFISGELDISHNSIKVGIATIDGEGAYVDLTVLWSNSNLMSGFSRQQESAILKQQDGLWKITYFPYPYWYWDWNEDSLIKK